MTSYDVFQYVAGFPPEIGTSHLEYELAMGLAEKGHAVTVFTLLPRKRTSVQRVGGTCRAFAAQNAQGARIVRFHPQLSGNTSLASKGLDYFLSGISVIQSLFFFRRTSAMLVSSPPLTVAFTAALLGALFKIPLILRVGDIHPESLSDIGISRRSLIYRLLSWMQWFVYSKAQKITILCPEQEPYLLVKGVEKAKIELVSNWASNDTIRDPALPKEDVLKGILHEGKTVLFYGGSLSYYQDIGTIIEAAKRLAGEPLLFIIMGGGPLLEGLSAKVKAEGLKNVVLLPPHEKGAYLGFISAADAAFVPMGEWASTPTIPSKAYEIMARGKPIIAICSPKSALSNLIRETRSGVVVPSRDAEALSREILALHGDKMLRQDLGQNGRDYILGCANIDSAVACYERVIAEIYPKKGGS